MYLVNQFKKIKAEGKKITIVTAYDYWSAKLVSETNVDGILVGDCAAMVMHGEESTVNCDIETIAMHVRDVRKGAPKKFIIAAVPFLSNRKGLERSMDNIEQLMKAGANAVKIEAVAGNEKLIRHLTESGIPVVGHIGLTPSHHHMVGGFKVQGKTLEEELQIVENGKIMQDLGCFCVVVEAVPPRVGHALSQALEVPVIGVGAGIDVDGQAMVLHDMLGLFADFKPKFVRHYLNGAELIKNAVNEFVADVHELKYPNEKESYTERKEAAILRKAA